VFYLEEGKRGTSGEKVKYNNKAIKDFKMAIKLNPDYAVEGYKGIGYAYSRDIVERGRSDWSGQNWERINYGNLNKALESYKKVLQIDPNDCYALANFQHYSRLARKK